MQYNPLCKHQHDTSFSKFISQGGETVMTDKVAGCLLVEEADDM